MTLPTPDPKNNTYIAPVPAESKQMQNAKAAIAIINSPYPDMDAITVKMPDLDKAHPGDVKTITKWRHKPESEYHPLIIERAKRGYAYWLSIHRTTDGQYMYHPEIIVNDRLAELRAIYSINLDYDVKNHNFKPFKI